ncbi:MAG: Nre family DNA repair protein [Methanosarcina sp.]|uniref:Nre family DNA repair protein n=1 Tax=Methanosarcina sp. TaxID=2213 RepID=UPI0026172B16|nr:Nre family DNA repair protein [Methanosarcina sp.]MDD3246761.1 Nre family DNA repair protein [Methanosarcina sp.]MDD4249504.1 Nre family DNA repair protein [Methanosarcina sp.]
MKDTLCIKCKGKGLCGRPRCPILEKFKSLQSISPVISGDSIFGASPPALFVGSYGYPRVSAGPLIPPLATENEALLLEDPSAWGNMQIEDIISMRSRMVRANTSLHIKDARSKENPLLAKAQELALSRKPVDTEAWFFKAPKQELKFDAVLTPMGPSGLVKNFELAENPDVPKKVDYLVYDTDALAKDTVTELLKSDVSTEHITRLFSIGLLGKERKIVPTRWSITAVDDMAGKELADRIRDFPWVSDIKLFSGTHFGNHFEVLILPRAYSFELIEIWLPKTVWSGESSWIGEDSEGLEGKKGYSPLAGGYYAARLPVLEYLTEIKRQASVFVLREITPDYWAPLGVWVVREGMRKALQNPPKSFDSLETAISDLTERVKTPKLEWVQQAKMLSNFRFQTTLDSFFKA